MARGFVTGVETMQSIVAHFGVHWSTLIYAMRWPERADAGLTAPESSYRKQTSDFPA
jgi:hypothetical protein